MFLTFFQGLETLHFPSPGSDFRSQPSNRQTRLSTTPETVKSEPVCPSLKHQDLRQFEAGSVFADVVILDPPRAGAAGLLPKASAHTPQAHPLCCLSAPSLARDMRALDGKYKLTELSLFEFFPWDAPCRDSGEWTVFKEPIFLYPV